MAPRMTAVAVLALLMSVVVLALVRPETFWSVDGPSLEASIEDRFGGYEIENCARTSGDDWRCDYAFDSLSGPAGRIRVRLRGDRCWSASIEDDESARSAESCVSAWQFFRAM